MMPPTVAAATMTTSGRCAFIQSSTGCWRRRSTSPRSAVRIGQSSRASRRTRAPPTMPRWPATKMRRPPSGNISGFAGAALMLFAHRRQIGRHHLGHQFAETRLVAPAQLGPRLGRIALQEINFGGAEVPRIDGNQDLPVLGVDTLLLGSGAAPGDRAADLGEGQFDEFAHRMSLARGDHIVARSFPLCDQPHGLDVIAGMAPIALGIEIAEIEARLKALVDRGHRAGDLAGDEGLAARRPLMVEEDAVV